MSDFSDGRCMPTHDTVFWGFVAPSHTGGTINNLSYGGLQPELRAHMHNVSYEP